MDVIGTLVPGADVSVEPQPTAVATRQANASVRSGPATELVISDQYVRRAASGPRQLRRRRPLGKEY
jgi:hypothetical protein